MCIADIAISRRTYVNRVDVTPATITRIPANPDRIALMFQGSFNTTIQGGLSMTQLDAAAGKYFYVFAFSIAAGAPLTITGSPIITYITHPGIVQSEMWMYQGGSLAAYYETIMNDDLANELRQYLKEQRTAYTRRG